MNFLRKLGWLSKTIIVLIIIVPAAIFLWPKVEGTLTGGSSPDLVGALNTWSGFAPIVYLNGGKDVNEDSRLTKEFGLKLKIEQMDVRQNCIDALKEDKVDFIYNTTDVSPIEMDAQSDFVKMGVQQILKIDGSGSPYGGADVIVATRSIKNVNDFRGKKVAVAIGTASHTLLLRVLESGGLTQDDINIVKCPDGIEAAKMFKNGEVDIAVVWSPDDGDCYAAIKDSHPVFSTQQARNIIMDGIVVKESVYKKKQKDFFKLAIAWLTINAETNELVRQINPETFVDEISKLADGERHNLPAIYDSIATCFANTFGAPVFVVADGMYKVRFSTYGDNVNFFGLNTSFEGVTGNMLYTKMIKDYREIGLANNPVSWRQASNPSLIQSITTLNSGIHSAESEVSFSPVTAEIASAEAVSTKMVSINFALNQYQLDDLAKDKIDKEIGPIIKGFNGCRFALEGNTDNTGSREINKVISKKRAQSVADYLMKEWNVKPNQIVRIVGNGPDKPVVGCENNSNEYQRSENRRTEFQLINQ